MSTAEFTLFLSENSDFLRPFAINLTKDHESAKDLYQETLFRALSNKDKYNVGTNIKAWLYTIMRNIFINDYRKKAKQSTVLDNSPNDFLIDQTYNKVVNDAIKNNHSTDWIEEKISEIIKILDIDSLLTIPISFPFLKPGMAFWLRI